MENNNKKTTNLSVDIDVDESSELWSFRNKDDSTSIKNKKELTTIEKITQKVNQTLINSAKNKNNIISEPNLKYFEEERKNLDFFKKSIEKELEIFESERKMELMNKNSNKNNLMNLNMTLSELNQGTSVFVSKDDLIINLPTHFLIDTNSDDIGNEFIINLKEVDKYIPSDDYISKFHLEYSKDNDN